MLLLPNPPDSKLWMHMYVLIYALANVHFYKSMLLPCVYIVLAVVYSREYFNHVTYCYMDIEHAIAYIHSYFLNIYACQLVQEPCIYWRVT